MLSEECNAIMLGADETLFDLFYVVQDTQNIFLKLTYLSMG